MKDEADRKTDNGYTCKKGFSEKSDRAVKTRRVSLIQLLSDAKQIFLEGIPLSEYKYSEFRIHISSTTAIYKSIRDDLHCVKCRHGPGERPDKSFT